MRNYFKQVSVLAALAFLALLVMPAAVLGQGGPAAVKGPAPMRLVADPKEILPDGSTKTVFRDPQNIIRRIEVVDTHNNKTRETEYDAKGNPTRDFGGEYKYDAKGNVVADKTVTTEYTDKGTTQQTLSHDYNNGETVIVREVDKDGTKTVSKSYIQKDKDGNQLVSETSSTKDGKRTSYTRTEYYPDGKTIKNADRYNPATGKVEATNRDGKPIPPGKGAEVKTLVPFHPYVLPPAQAGLPVVKGVKGLKDKDVKLPGRETKDLKLKEADVKKVKDAAKDLKFTPKKADEGAKPAPAPAPKPAAPPVAKPTPPVAPPPAAAPPKAPPTPPAPPKAPPPTVTPAPAPKAPAAPAPKPKVPLELK